MSLQNTTAALLTTASTSTLTGTTIQWITRWAFPQVTISCPLPDPASASYPYAWMTASGEAIESDLSSYSATAHSSAAMTSPMALTGCPATTTPASSTSATDLGYYNPSSTPSTTSNLLITSSSLPGSSIYTTDTAMTITVTDGTENQTDTPAPPVTAAPTAPSTTSLSNCAADAYVTETETESIYMFISDGSIVSFSANRFADSTTSTSTPLAASATSSSSSPPSITSTTDQKAVTGLIRPRQHSFTSSPPESRSWTTIVRR